MSYLYPYSLFTILITTAYALLCIAFPYSYAYCYPYCLHPHTYSLLLSHYTIPYHYSYFLFPTAHSYYWSLSSLLHLLLLHTYLFLTHLPQCHSLAFSPSPTPHCALLLPSIILIATLTAFHTHLFLSATRQCYSLSLLTITHSLLCIINATLTPLLPAFASQHTSIPHCHYHTTIPGPYSTLHAPQSYPTQHAGALLDLGQALHTPNPNKAPNSICPLPLAKKRRGWGYVFLGLLSPQGAKNVVGEFTHQFWELGSVG